MPSQWLEGSLRSMQMMQSKHSMDSGAVHIPPTLEDMVYNMHFADDHSSQGGDLRGVESKSPPLKFESLPDSYYEKSTPKVSEKKTVAGGTIQLSKSHARLLHSPFGDPTKILEKELQKKKKPTSRVNSAKSARKPEEGAIDTAAAAANDGGEQAKLSEADFEYPKLAKKHAIIAERLFGSAPGGDSQNTTNVGSALDQLSYEEKLMVMLMQVKDEMEVY
jgi:hypothetical protein